MCVYLSDFVETSGPVPGGVMETLESLRMIHVCTVQPSPIPHMHKQLVHTHTHAQTDSQQVGRGSFNPSSITIFHSPPHFPFSSLSFFPHIISPSSLNRTISHIVLLKWTHYMDVRGDLVFWVFPFTHRKARHDSLKESRCWRLREHLHRVGFFFFHNNCQTWWTKEEKDADTAASL